MHKCSLGIHEIKFVIKPGPRFRNGSSVAEHTDGSGYLSEITTWNHSGWLVIDAHFETSWAPVNKLNGPLSLDCGNGGIDILRDHITPV